MSLSEQKQIYFGLEKEKSDGEQNKNTILTYV